MAKITRKTQKVFAESATILGQFGSAQAGTFVNDSDPDIIMALPAWALGLPAATVSGSKLITLEERQALDYVMTRQTAYILQEGIPEYDAGTTYYINSVVKESGTVTLYRSLTNDNVGNALSDGAEWELLADLANISGLPALGSANEVLQVNAGGVALEYDLIGVDNISSGAASDGQVLTSDGAGGVAFETLDVPVDSVNGQTGVVVLDKDDVGLSNVPNTDCTNASNISSGTLAGARLPNSQNTIGVPTLAAPTTSASHAYGSTLAGSGLQPSSAGGGREATALSGTWRCLGRSNGNSGADSATLWIRIS